MTGRDGGFTESPTSLTCATISGGAPTIVVGQTSGLDFNSNYIPASYVHLPVSSSCALSATFNLGGTEFVLTGTLSKNSAGIISLNSPVVTEAAPILAVSAGPLSFAGGEGGPFAPGSQAYTVSNSGGGTLTGTIVPSETWINVSPSTFSVTNGAPLTVSVTIDSGPGSGAISLAPGVYFRNIAFNSNGGTENRTVRLTVTDATPPVIGPVSDLTEEATSPSGAAVTYPPVTATDNVDPTPTITFSPVSGTTFALGGPHPVTVTATDDTGNFSQKTFNVTVVDTTPPAIAAFGNITVNTDAGQPYATVTYTPTATDAVGPVTITTLPVSGTQFAIGTTPVTITASDGAGNSSTASFTVTVQDNEAPTLDVPGNITVNTDLGLPTAQVTYSVTFDDNVPGATILQTAGLPSGSNFPIGATLNTFKVTDAAGNTTTKSFTVTVIDNEPPMIVGLPTDITVEVDYPDTGAVISFVEPTVTDNAPGATITLITPLGSGATFPLGTTVVTYKAEDAVGNFVTGSFNVIVNQIPPGYVTIAVQSGVSDGIFGFSSPETQFNFSVTTSGGLGQAPVVTIKPGTYLVTEILPSGFGLTGGSCTDGDSTIDVGTLTATIHLASDETVTCTFESVDSRTKTVQTIQRFLQRRNDLLLSNGPDRNREIDRLLQRGGNPAGAGLTEVGAGLAQYGAKGGATSGASASGIGLSASTPGAASGPSSGGALFAGTRLASGLGDGPTNYNSNTLFTGDGEGGLFGRSALGSAFDRGPEASGRVLPFAFNFAGDGLRSTSFSTSLVQIAAAAADAKRRKLAGGAENLQRLGIRPETLITPQTFDLDVWLQGRVVSFDDGEGGEDEGHFSVVYLGMDYVLSPDLLIGAMVQYDHMEERSEQLATSVEGRGWMVGPYATARLSEAIFLQTRAAWGRSRNDIAPFLTYTDQFQTERWLAEGTLQGRWRYGNWSLRPQATVSYIEETQEAYVDSLNVLIPEQRIALGQARAGPQIAYRFVSSAGGMIEPYLGFEGIWNFESSGVSVVATTLASEEDVRGKVEVGFRALSVEGITLDASGSYDGIGTGDYHAVTGTGRLGIPLN